VTWVVTGTVVGGGLINGFLNNQAADRAADAQSDAAKKSNSESRRQYDLARKDNEPWREAGAGALKNLVSNDFMKSWQTDPGYEFRLSEGNKALNAAAAARGLSNSGRTLKELTRYGQDYSSNEYNNVYNRQYNRLSALAGIGQSANQSNAAAGANYANSYGQNTMGAANAQSAAQIAQANALGNVATSGANAYLMTQLLKK
jgi:hypothetical protein